MKRIAKCLLASITLLSLVSSSIAQNSPINVVTTAVPFLRISPDARAGGMGDLGVATTPDVNSQFYNVAKYAFASNPSGIGMTYTPWLKDFNSFRPRELAVDAGYSRKLSERLSLGIALRYINSNLAGGQAISGVSYKPGNAVSGDVGLYYNSLGDDGSGLSLGLALTNLGSKISYTSDATQKDYIPANFTLGAVYTSVSNEVNKLSFGLDIHKLMVPTPPLLGDSAGLVNYRSKGVVGSWFSSFGDATGGFAEELKEL